MHVFLLTLGDMFTPENGENEPDWVTKEKKHFSEFRDMNKVCSGEKKNYQHHLGEFPGYSFKFHDLFVFVRTVSLMPMKYLIGSSLERWIMLITRPGISFTKLIKTT